MREIKFRAYSDHFKVMMPIEDIGWDDDGTLWVYVIHPDSGPIEEIGDEVHLMQYTGLHDKNGREIFESDMVRWGDTPNSIETPVRIALVKFDPDICFESYIGRFEYGNFAYKETDKYLTVIGNVYDNPELLEVVK
ncbi:YopX family protein [Lacticaseibacillus hulanensis]|uniref:YopX family protein n=1 Tax=Lacticaseibacillus hulanensis TaxID=2493111 RepID=UPI000FD85395|nr:YopX family protein [Lacticaseibacillus hulanensis]